MFQVVTYMQIWYIKDKYIICKNLCIATVDIIYYAEQL